MTWWGLCFDTSDHSRNISHFDGGPYLKKREIPDNETSSLVPKEIVDIGWLRVITTSSLHNTTTILPSIRSCEFLIFICITEWW